MTAEADKPMNVVVLGLLNLAKSTAARRLLESLETTLPSTGEVSEVDATAEALEVERGQVVQFFKQLDAAGCGRFIAGRRGHSSRFKWTFEPVSVAQAALKRRNDLDLLGSEDAGGAESAGEMIEETVESEDEAAAPPIADDNDNMVYNFPLRRGIWVTFNLPISLTKSEAERLTAFIQALPVK